MYVDNIKLLDGWVYVLPPSTFKETFDDNGELTSELVSELPVKPIEVIRVTPRMLELLGIEVDIKS